MEPKEVRYIAHTLASQRGAVKPYDELADDIKQNGLREPIVLLDGKILDGRRRYRACLKAGIPVQTRNFGDRPDDIDDAKYWLYLKHYMQDAESPVTTQPPVPEAQALVPVTPVGVLKLPLEKIRLDGGTQPRAEINEIVVGEYRDDMRNGAVFPPVTVFYDGTDFWLADGFHRYRAKLDLYDGRETKDNTIEADVRQGTQRDAILFAVGANATHGERRKNTDKRRAVETLLRDAEWGQWSDREIAKRCAVGHAFVSELRRSLSTVDSDKSERTYITKHGTQAVMHTANIGKSAPEEFVVEAWQSLRDLFRAWQDKYALRLRDLHAGREVIDKSRRIEGILALKPRYTDAERWQRAKSEPDVVDAEAVVIEEEGGEDAA